MARYVLNDVEVHVEQWHEQGQQMLVLFHGFTGSTKTWHPVVEQLPQHIRVIAVDLIGHGQSAAPQDVHYYSMAAQVELLEALFKELQLTTFTLVGYSMGGRVALSYAVQYPKRIEQLILESASPGLAMDEARSERKKSDDELAKKIMQNGVPVFVDKWENIPLFSSQKRLPEDVQQQIRNERLSQTAIGLANSLRGMGTGVMPALWDELATLSMPVTLITGALDEKFMNLNDKMVKLLPQASHMTIPEVGHAIHVENPIKFATIVKETIS
jgi:2-succinyl-6-hydroxy-2,4-cyclohexadiene-1-carboxylate synthase